MPETKHVQRLRLYLGEYDNFGRVDLYEEVMSRAQRLGIAGVTVVRGIAGYHLRPGKLSTTVRSAASRPIVVEIVDTKENIDRLIDATTELLEGFLITVERVEALHFRGGEAGSSKPQQR